VLGVAVGVIAGCVAGIVGTLAVTWSPERAAAERAVPVLPLVTAVVVSQRLTDAVDVPCVPAPDGAARRWQCQVPDATGAAKGDRLDATADGKKVSVDVVGTASDPDSGAALLVVEAPREVRSQASLEVRVVMADTKTDVLTVPAGAVWAAGDASPVLRVPDGDATRDVRVETGVAANGWVEVRGAGISAGQVVIIRGPA